MSNKSSNEEPNGTGGWQWPEPEFPPERHPDRDLFSDDVIDSLLECGGVPVNSSFRALLQGELRDLARNYMRVALNTPLGVPYGPKDTTLTKRADWLTSNIINPCHRLLAALADNNAPKLSNWPDEIPYLEPDRLVLMKELSKLHEWAVRLQADLRGRVSEGVNHTREFETEVVFKLTEIFQRYFPNERLSRGTYHRGQGMIARFPDFIRIASREILRITTDMDRLIEEAVNVYRP
jgi:hypothetical protein